MNSVRFKVLSCLCEHDVLTPIEISKLIGVHKNNVSRELGILVGLGLVYCLNPDWFVGRLYSITSKGKRMVKREQLKSKK